MKLMISTSAARAAAFIAIATRVFLGLSLEAPGIRGGAWLSAMLCAAPVMLYLRGLLTLNHRSNAHRAALFAVLLGCCLLDAHTAARALARSAGYLALDRVPVRWLALPVCLAMLWCVRRNGDAMGYGAMLAMRILGASLALIVVLQVGRLRPAWLTPLLGAGPREVLSGALRASGWCVPATALLLLGEPGEDNESARTLTLALAGLGLAALLLAIAQMMTPVARIEPGWLTRLDALLTNGRAPLYMQLPIIALWYAALLHLCLWDCTAAAALMQRLRPKLDGRLCAVIVTGAVALTFLFDIPVEGLAEALAPWQFSIVSTAVSAAMLFIDRRSGGEKPWALGGSPR